MSERGTIPGGPDGWHVAVAEPELINAQTAVRLADFFNALSDPTRVRIIGALAASECSVGDLAEALDLTPSAVSHQLRMLRDLRMVRPRKVGRQVYYALDDDHIADLFRQGLDHVRHG